MRKLIHSDFEIDLNNYKITDTEQNPWFLDEITLKFTFPFTMGINDEVDTFFGFISSYQTMPETVYNVLYVHGNQMEQAVLELEEYASDKLSATFSYGYDQIPSWDKKLAELPLDNFALPEPETIYEHAKAVMAQAYPAVNYNFPMVHTDKIDTEDDAWFAFGGFINWFDGTDYVENYVDIEDDITYNRNIMQPLPYALHILKKGFEDANLELVGDVLTDSRLRRKLIYADVDYYTTIAQESQSIILMSEDFVEETEVPYQTTFITRYATLHRFFSTLEIEQPGKYRLVGRIYIYRSHDVPVWVKIRYRDTVIWSRSFSPVFSFATAKITLNVNLIVETLSDLQDDDISVEIVHVPTTDQVIAELDLNPIRLHDESGEAIPSILNLNQINLSRAVPDMTFGEFVKYIKNRYNYDMDVANGQVTMSLIENHINPVDAFDLSTFEIQMPVRRFNKGKSFEMKFAEVDSKDYDFPSIYQSATSVQTSGYVTNEKTSIIEINALPLPLLFRNEVQTAHAFESGNNKVYEVLYNGLQDGLPIAQNPSEISIPAVHATNWQKWMAFRINAQSFRWRFLAWFDDLAGFKTKGKAWAYGKLHVVKEVQRTEVATDLFEIEIETESIE